MQGGPGPPEAPPPLRGRWPARAGPGVPRKSRSRGPREIAVVGCGFRGVGWWGADFLGWGGGVARMSRRYVLPLADCALEEAGRVGGKAVGLGRLLRQSLTVPPGFVVTADAYRDWVAGRALQQHLDRLLAGAADADAEHAGDLVAEIGAAYARLGEGADVPAAVRSSATAEDRRDASFAGQQETFLGVTGTAAVVRHVVRCWASLFTPHAIGYRRRLGVPADQVAMAVVVQRVVPAEASGVMLTVDPVTGDPSQIEIEATHGLGMPLVGGE